MESRLAVLSKGPTDHARQNEPPFVRGGGETPRIMQLSLKDRRVELEMLLVIWRISWWMERCVCANGATPPGRAWMRLIFQRGLILLRN